jgi:hypothetical protein
MSAQAASVLLYVELFDEGTPVWRPARGVPVEGGFRIEPFAVGDDNGERWAFPPGSLVQARRRQFDDGEAWVACAAETTP